LRRTALVIAILDAKYIDLWRNEPSTSILYQLTTYTLSQGTESCATILYPTMDDMAAEARIEVRNPLHGRVQAQIALRPVHLGWLVQLITEKPDYRTQNKCTAFAKYLIFGDEE
jgi:hypothetical protein